MEPSSSRCETPPPSYEECTRSRPTTPHSQIYIQDGDKLILIPTSNSGIVYSRPGTPQHGYQNRDQPVTIFVSPPAEEPHQATHQISEDRDDADAEGPEQKGDLWLVVLRIFLVISCFVIATIFAQIKRQGRQNGV